jgi:hypothetical protein
MTSAYVWKLLIPFEIFNFNRGVFAFFALLGHYTASVGIFVQTFDFAQYPQTNDDLLILTIRCGWVFVCVRETL